MKSLIVGLGFGEAVYRPVLEELGAEIVAVDNDPDKDAYRSIDAALHHHSQFDTAHICTPNFLHEPHARAIAANTDILFVDKPGVGSAKAWKTMVEDFPNTRIMMVKNNMWRDNLDDLREKAEWADEIRFNWINKDRVPNPGTWFTTKKKAFGGVSADLMPHLLSMYIALNPDWRVMHRTNQICEQRYSLKEVSKTDYGRVNPFGTYDVDDLCAIEFGPKYKLTADWRNIHQDLINIEFENDHRLTHVRLGLCPESAYKAMIGDAMNHIDDGDFWRKQFEIDMWIHQQLEYK